MTEQQLVGEPLVRFTRERILCASSGKPLDALECFCCTGLNCPHHEGSHLRLWNDIKARPWRYEDMAWVFRLTPALRRLRRD